MRDRESGDDRMSLSHAINDRRCSELIYLGFPVTKERRPDLMFRVASRALWSGRLFTDVTVESLSDHIKHPDSRRAKMIDLHRRERRATSPLRNRLLWFSKSRR
jgi:hypothetical protein